MFMYTYIDTNINTRNKTRKKSQNEIELILSFIEIDYRSYPFFSFSFVKPFKAKRG